MFTPRFSQSASRLAASDDELWQVHTEALARKDAGEDIIVMSVGDPDLPTIDPIIEHAVTNLYRGRTHYSPGMGELPLREKIAQIETEASGKQTSADEVVIFPGATNAIRVRLALRRPEKVALDQLKFMIMEMDERALLSRKTR